MHFVVLAIKYTHATKLDLQFAKFQQKIIPTVIVIKYLLFFYIFFTWMFHAHVLIFHYDTITVGIIHNP